MSKKYETPRLDRPWTEVNPGGVVTEPGNSVTYITGTWRTMRPVRDLEQCTQCLICWIMCPDSSITVEAGSCRGRWRRWRRWRHWRRRRHWRIGGGVGIWPDPAIGVFAQCLPPLADSGICWL